MSHHIKTHKGQVCRFPDGTLVTEAGAVVKSSSFFIRRVLDGSIILSSYKSKPKPAEKTTEKTTGKTGDAVKPVVARTKQAIHQGSSTQPEN